MMRMPFYSRIVAPCILLVLLIVAGQQGYIVYSDYQKTADKIARSDTNVQPLSSLRGKAFSLFSVAASSRVESVTAAHQTLNVEVQGIIYSDTPWLSFATLKTEAAQQSLREGDPLPGYADSWLQEIHQDSVVVYFQGQHKRLKLSNPAYFKGNSAELADAPVPRPTPASPNLSDYFVLKPDIRQGHLEGYFIHPRNATPVFTRSGLEQGDVVVKINSVDMTHASQAKEVIARWETMKEAEITLRRHDKLTNVKINVLNP